MLRRILLSGLIAIAGLCSPVLGVITNYTSLTAYTAAVGSHPIITFREFPVGTVLGTQYNSLGVTFTDGNDTITSSPSFVTDGVGVDAIGRFDLSFSTHQTAIGADYPGALAFDLYLDSTLIGSSAPFGGSGSGFFGGVSSEPFNRVVVRDWVDNFAYIDNLHLGPASPEPSTLALLGIGASILLASALRRRKQGT
jgi:hypothetical protein